MEPRHEPDRDQEQVIRLLNLLVKGQKQIMVDLTALAAELVKLQNDANAASTAVLANLATLQAQIADLQAQITQLTTGAITQAQIDALDASATAIDTTVTSITAAVTPAP